MSELHFQTLLVAFFLFYELKLFLESKITYVWDQQSPLLLLSLLPPATFTE